MKQTTVLTLITTLTVLWVTMLGTANASEPPPPITAPAPVLTPSGTDEATRTPAERKPRDLTIEGVGEILAKRTPAPSPTPGPLDNLVEQVANKAGLARKNFLGLRAEDWIDLGASILLVVVGSLLLIPLFFALLGWAVRRTKTKFDDRFLAIIGRELKWFVVIILTRGAFLRLDFWSDQSQILLDDLFFFLAFGVLFIISLRLVALAIERYRDRWVPEANRKRLNPILEVLKRLGYLFVSMIGLSIVMSHFGINVTLPAAAIFFVLVIAAIATREAVSDAVAGFFILLNQPFRVGDDIRLKELDTWGRVVEIGIRITRICTLDNREVVIPNALIGQSQVVNYTHPDPTLRVQTDLGVAYGSDIDQAERVIEAAVRDVEGVLPDKPVEVRFLRFGNFARKIRVLWWIDEVNHEYPIRNRVNRTIERALSEAGIECPFPTHNLNLSTEAENSSHDTQVLSDGSGKGSSQETN